MAAISLRYSRRDVNKTMLFAAVSIAVLGAALFLIRKKRFIHRITGGDIRSVIVLTQNVDEGEFISGDSFRVDYRPGAYVEPRHVDSSERNRVMGLRVRHPLAAGTTLVWSDLAELNGATQLDQTVSESLPMGYRALGVVVETATFPGLIRAGDHVDVFYTTTTPQVTALIAQNIPVIRDESTLVRSRNESNSWRRTVTIAVPVSDASLLRQASLTGLLSFAVRSREDQLLVAEMPYVDITDLIEAEVREVNRTRRVNHQPRQIERIESNR